MSSSKSVNVHATCVRLGEAGAAFGASADAGVLILGKSGTGKSDLAIRLIAMGAQLVSDDRTDLFLRRGKLYARAPANLKGMIEARGVGILALPGVAAAARICLAVALGRPKTRIPSPIHYLVPLGLSAPPPLIRLAPFEASAPAKVALAVAGFERKLFRETARQA